MKKPLTLAIDVGGSAIKAMILNDRGTPITPLAQVPTPQPAATGAVLDTIATLADQLGTYDRVSVGFPGVVKQGVTSHAINLGQQWQDFPLAEKLGQKLAKPVRIANDADVQGMAAIGGKGVELVITLGTGMGSALFLEGKLLPNLELGQHIFRDNQTYEAFLGNTALQHYGPDRWNQYLQEAIAAIEILFNYDVLYLGGGNTRVIDQILPANVQIVPNVLGILGGMKLWETASNSI